LKPSNITCIFKEHLVKSEKGGRIMQTAVTKRGQTVIPAAIRKRYHIQEGDQLVWLDDGQTIRIVPIPADPIRALRGSGRGERLVERLLADRREDRNRES
jgi:AbrB family looped-hinge helix DNA binding protein